MGEIGKSPKKAVSHGKRHDNQILKVQSLLSRHCVVIAQPPNLPSKVLFLIRGVPVFLVCDTRAALMAQGLRDDSSHLAQYTQIFWSEAFQSNLRLSLARLLVHTYPRTLTSVAFVLPETPNDPEDSNTLRHISLLSPCRKRGEAKGDRQKSDQKPQKSDKMVTKR